MDILSVIVVMLEFSDLNKSLNLSIIVLRAKLPVATDFALVSLTSFF